MSRPALIKDIPDIVRMLRKFHAEADMPAEYDDVSMYNFISNMICENQIVLVSGESCIVGFITPAPYNSAWKMALELYWWSEDGRGIEMMNDFIEAGIDRGAQEIRFSCRAITPKIGRFLIKSGFSHDEQVYMRVV